MNLKGVFSRTLNFLFVGILVSACAPQDTPQLALEAQETQGIVNGQRVTPKMKDPLAPLIVQLELETHDAKKRKIYTSSCTGVLIHPNVAITAAHCIREAQLIPAASIHKFPKDAEYPALHVISYDKKVSRRASLAITHSEYNSKASSRYNDLALVFIDKPFYKDWSKFPDLKFDPNGVLGPGAIVTAYGYGANQVSINAKGEKELGDDGVLRRKIFKIISSQDANPRLWRFDDVIYISSIPSEKEGSVCNGDSGGAAFANINGSYVLVGITSYTLFSCKGDAALISIRDHITWIQNKVLEGFSIGF